MGGGGLGDADGGGDSAHAHVSALAQAGILDASLTSANPEACHCTIPSPSYTFVNPADSSSSAACFERTPLWQ